MPATMAKKKASDLDGREKPEAARRLHAKYVGLPAELWEKLKAWADREDRSISWAARRAVREFLERQGIE